MKAKTTKRAIMHAYENVIKVGYDDLQDALKWREPNFYTAGLYGWNCDVYVIDYGTVIVTGIGRLETSNFREKLSIR